MSGTEHSQSSIPHHVINTQKNISCISTDIQFIIFDGTESFFPTFVLPLTFTRAKTIEDALFRNQWRSLQCLGKPAQNIIGVALKLKKRDVILNPILEELRADSYIIINAARKENQTDLVDILVHRGLYFNPESLKELDHEDQYQCVGERLYRQISKLQPENAGKITGMLLDGYTPIECAENFCDNEIRRADIIAEAMEVLRHHLVIQ
jgi:hypothetical protein